MSRCFYYFKILVTIIYIHIIININKYKGVANMSIENQRQRNAETEVFIDSFQHAYVYRDMRAKYEEVKENREISLEEKNESVSKYISEKYEITKQEAIDLYTYFEIEISKFQHRKLKQ